MAYSCILDTEEILVAMNLEDQPRTDFITVDRRLSAPGQTMTDLLDPKRKAKVHEANVRAHVQLTLPPHGMVIMKCL